MITIDIEMLGIIIAVISAGFGALHFHFEVRFKHLYRLIDERRQENKETRQRLDSHIDARAD